MAIKNKPVVFIKCLECDDVMILIWIDCESSEMPSKLFCPSCGSKVEEIKELRL